MVRFGLILLFIISYTYSKTVDIDDILTKRDSYKIDIILSYINIEKEQGLLTPVEYQTKNGDVVTIPTFLGDERVNQDYFNYAINFKYGFTNRLELFSLLNFYTSTIYYTKALAFSSKNDSDFSSWVLGFNYQLKNEDTMPALLFGGMLTAIEHLKFGIDGTTKRDNLSFKSYKISATTYYSVDPLVYLLNLSYYVNRKKILDNIDIDNSNTFTLSPQLYFAINPYSSINFGLKYSHFGKNRLNGRVISNSGSNVSFMFGSSYEISNSLLFNLTALHSKQLNISKDSISVGLSYSF
jgi:hypothetical protein